MPTLSPNLLTTPPAASGKAASTNNKAEAAPEQAFGSVLARQLNTEQPAAETTAASTGKTGKKLLAVEVTADTSPSSAATTPGSDPAANLIAMLQTPVELRPSVVTAQAETLSKVAGKTTGISLSDKLSANSDVQVSRTSGKPLGAAGEPLHSGAQKQTDLAPTLDMSPLKDTQPVPDAKLLPEAVAAAPRAQDVAAFNAPALSAVPTAAANVASTPVTVATPMGSSVWSDDFAQQVTWMASGKLEQSASLHLNPPNLGPLEVVVKVSDSQATVLFSSPHGAVREAIENAMPKLRELMTDNGITLGNTSVSDQSPRERGSANDNSTPRRSNWENDDSVVNTARIGSTPGVALRHQGMLDTYA